MSPKTERPWEKKKTQIPVGTPSPASPVSQRFGGYQQKPFTSSGKSIFGTYSELVGKGVSAFQGLPVVKQLGQATGAAVGSAAAVMRGGVELAGTPLVQASRVLSGERPETMGETAARVKSGAKEGWEFGYDVGFTGGSTAPLGAGGKLVQGALATGALAQGIETTKEGFEEDSDWKKALGVGEAILGLWGVKGAASTKGVVLNKEYAIQRPAAKPLPMIAAADVPGTMEKTGEIMTGVKASEFVEAARPGMKPKVQKYLGSENLEQEGIDLGKRLWDTAKKEQSKASAEYQASKDELMSQIEPAKIPETNRLARSAVTEEVKRERVRLVPSEDGSGLRLDFSSSRYKENPEAQGHFESIMRIVSDDPKDIDGLIASQEALSGIKRKINTKTDPDLKRFVGNLEREYDRQIDFLTGGMSTELRQSYAKSIQPAKKVMNAIGVVDKNTGSVNFDPNKAKTFMTNAMRDRQTSQKDIVKMLDESVGTSFSEDVRAMSLAERMSKPTPQQSTSAVQQSIRGGIESIPFMGFLKPLFSPQVWARHYLESGATPVQAVKGGQNAVLEMTKAILPVLNAQSTRQTQQ